MGRTAIPPRPRNPAVGNGGPQRLFQTALVEQVGAAAQRNRYAVQSHAGELKGEIMIPNDVGRLTLASAITGLLIVAVPIVGMTVFASRATIPVTGEWRFNEPQPEWKSLVSVPGFEPAHIERTADSLRVTLREGAAPTQPVFAGGIYIDLPDWRREDWAEVLVRARTISAVTNMRIGLDRPDGEVASAAAAQPSPFAVFVANFQGKAAFTPGGETPVVRDGVVHTYRIFLDWGTERTGPLRRVGLQFQATMPGAVDILSIRVVPAAARTDQNRMIETMLEPPRLKSDFALFRRALEEGHPALYRWTTKRELDTAFDRAEAELTQPMTILQFRNVLEPVLATIADGHLRFVNYQGDEIGAVIDSAKQFPLALTFEGDRAFVLLNQGLDERVKPGMEVVAINGASIGNILRRILPHLSHDGNARSWPMYQLGMWAADRRAQSFFQIGRTGRTGFSEAYRLYISDPASFKTTVRDPRTRNTLVVDLAGVTVAEAAVNVEENPLNREVLGGLKTFRLADRRPRVTGAESLRYLEREDTAVLTDAFGPNFPEVLEQMFSELKRQKTENLIIDMRGNTGGNDIYPTLLFSYLVSKEFRTIEGNHVTTFEPSFKPYTTFEIKDLATDAYFGPASGIWKPDPTGGWLMTEKYGRQYGSRFVGTIGVQKPAENHFEGPVYILINGGCFSACSAFTILADYYKRAMFIGDETGGVGSGAAGEDIGPTLPESHLHVGMPLESYFLAVDKRNRDRGTLPNFEVSQTIEDLAKGRDTVLEFTRELIRRGKKR